jgi:hypothetical protein
VRISSVNVTVDALPGGNDVGVIDIGPTVG